MDESRKAFEQWALEVMQFTPDDLTWDEARNCYRDYVPHMAWKGWQASRAAIEIELPESWHDEYMDHVVNYDETAKAIRAAGIKVKE
ncbi:hypothetical protein [Enterobacter hormaechei]|uniref:hypothetical protein n=1 Tax=Enterobacter hormaechei TaxID=158836 RepID=UPI00079154DD|nr:hypothetical protein [Enterobacter hormaechei]CZY59089.1 Uncharacterised protein [Enterobacter hormaechei]CZY63125.1 Uncharacterised protein [Enterobacter hormaechei]CZY72818.1 Uncharacterised protein [Enterobacter hormaechei]SAF36669.1 Uncharacterised protein [Enterobacter hormaechei]